ncbi:MAG: hypothetical protein AAF497_13445 [Planctomycetota bacterium]
MWIVLWFLSWFISPPVMDELPERSVTRIRKDLKSVLIQEAKADIGSSSHVQLIGRLLALHCEAVSHSTFRDGFVLQQSRGLLQSRLVKVERRIRRDVKQNAIAKRTDQPEQIPAFNQLAITLAQQIGGPFGPGAPFAPQQQPGAGGLGGAGLGGGLGVGGATTLPDYGEELADLIRQVINPEFWNEVGGPGSVVYFAPRQVLVVRATGQVHERVAQLLLDLRAAGGP